MMVTLLTLLVFMAPTRKRAFRIAHFGDLHLVNLNDVFDKVVAMLDDAVRSKADHFIFSGDILDAADPEVLGAFVEELRVRGLTDSSTLTVVPGNHDVFPLSWPPTFKSILRTIGKTAHNNYEEFARLTACARSGKEAHQVFSNKPYPFVKNLSDDVVLAGMDTTVNDRSLPISWAAGELPAEDVDEVKVFFDKNRDALHRIVVMHHYPFADFENGLVNMNFAEPDPATVRNWLGWANATLVLCGHIHGNRDRQAADGFRVVCTDSVNTYIHSEKYHEGLCYRLIELHPKGRVTVTDRVVKL